jgi:hypothetical protein
LIGYLGTLFTWTLARSDEGVRHAQTLQLEQAKQQASESLEHKKLEGTLILDAMRTGEGPEKAQRAAANLLLLADAKLVTFDQETQERLKKWRGDAAPGLPSPVKPSDVEAIDFGSDDYIGISRGKAKTSIATGTIETYERLDDLLDDLQGKYPDEKMLKRQPPLTLAFDFDRVPEENRHVTISGWLYAAKKEADNDFHLIVGTNPAVNPIRYMNMGT